MKGKIHLGKTADSRTRKKTQPQGEQSALKEETGYNSFSNYLLKKGFSSKTTSRYIRDLKKFTNWTEKENLQAATITYGEILSYIQSFKNQVKQRTVSCHIQGLKHYFNFLLTTGEITDNPLTQIQIRGIKRRSLYHILSKKELEQLYYNYEITSENSKDKNQNWHQASILTSRRNKIILGLMIYQGLTSEELGRLTEKDIKLREGKIFIAQGRRSNERELKLEAHQILDIMEYTLKFRAELLKQTGKSSEKFFISAGSSDHFRNIMNKIIKKLNKQNQKVTSANQIRSSVITYWLKNYNLREVQYMAGHRYVSSTEGYLINDLEDLQEEIVKYHPLA